MHLESIAALIAQRLKQMDEYAAIPPSPGRFASALSRQGRGLTTVFAVATAAMLAACANGLSQVGSSADISVTGAVAADVKPEPLAEAGPLGERTLGKPGAPVTVVEYASLGCLLSRAFQKATFPRFKKDYIDTGKVYFIFREFPIGKSPIAAAVAARCVAESDFFRVNNKFMNTTGQWNAREVRPDALYKVVQDTGLSRSAFDTCLANQKINDGIVWVKQRGRELGVEGTPTFFINGKKVRGSLSYEEMRKLIEEHLNSAPKPA